MNKLLNYIIISDSEILSQGMSAMLHRTNMISSIRVLTTDQFLTNYNRFDTASVFIVDVSVGALDIVSQIRSLGSLCISIIGLTTLQLAPSHESAFDTTIGIYADFDTLSKVISDITATAGLSITENDSDELTPREKEIVVCVVKGMSNKEIAQSMNVSVHTVTTHRRNIASKLQIHSPSALTIYAIVRKFVSIDEIKAELL